MNRQQIDALVKQMNVDTAKGEVDARVQQIVVRLLGDLFQAIEDLDIQPSEVWKGLEYFTDAGQANELGLLAAGLGLEHYLDLRADEADAKAGITGGTPRTIKVHFMLLAHLNQLALHVWMTEPRLAKSIP
ncbi:catechol 1,2-dioxygenase 2 [Acinetobacter baumannii 24845_8]|nr:catechol 1,2-dioxygenase 2 [Acinetobacter baumannii 24845_8]